MVPSNLITFPNPSKPLLFIFTNWPSVIALLSSPAKHPLGNGSGPGRGTFNKITKDFVVLS